jgi:hypothetical protein
MSDQHVTDSIARHWIDGAWVGSAHLSSLRGVRAMEEFQEIKTHFRVHRT